MTERVLKGSPDAYVSVSRAVRGGAPWLSRESLELRVGLEVRRRRRDRWPLYTSGKGESCSRIRDGARERAVVVGRKGVPGDICSGGAGAPQDQVGMGLRWGGVQIISWLRAHIIVGRPADL